MKNSIIIGLLILLGIGGAIGAFFLFHSSQEEAVQDEETREEYRPKEAFTLEVDGVEREFIVYRPNSLDVDEEVPVVFMFHGASGTGEKFYRISGWTDVADEEGFMVVFPTALKYRTYHEEKLMNGTLVEDLYQNVTRWNGFGLVNNLDPAYDQEVHSDVDFIRETIDFVSDEYAVDESRIYATGFSSGGSIVARLAVEATDLFAAFASVGSSVVPVDQVNVEGVQPRPYVVVIGEDDEKYAYYYDLDAVVADESFMLEANGLTGAMIDTMLEYNGLNSSYEYTKTDQAAIFTFDDPESAPEYRFVIFEDMGHMFPNGKNYPFVAAEAFWEFFNEYSL